MGLFQLTQFFSGALGVALTGSALVWQKNMPELQAYSNIFWGMSCIVIVAIISSVVYLAPKRIGVKQA
ncbi:hypothetical protein D3C73_722550 [compost metagenome]